MRILVLSTIPFLLASSVACFGEGDSRSQENPVDGEEVSLTNERTVQPALAGENTPNTASSFDNEQADSNSETTPELSTVGLTDQEASVQEGSPPSPIGADDDSMAAEEEPKQEAPPTLAATSSGCGKLPSATEALSISANAQQADYWVDLPENYDPNVAQPLVFAFHGRGRTHLEFRNVDAGQVQTEVGDRAIMVYVKSIAGNGWNATEEVQPNVDIFEALYPRVLADYCINPSEVFAIGHSSGGFFSNILACRFPARFRGIGSVAGATQECSGQVPAILVHGVTDTVVGFDRGVASRDGYLTGNGCSQGTAPVGIDACVAYQDCDEGLPVQWCEHSEPTYSDNNGPTNHGWPSFASRALGNFLFGLSED